jgi:hypothetical protein
VPIDPRKTYELSELIDLAQRTNPETRVAWERARQAAIAMGLAEGTYYPALARRRRRRWHTCRSDPDDGRSRRRLHGRHALRHPRAQPRVAAARLRPPPCPRGRGAALTMEATAGFNAKHQQIVFRSRATSMP